MDDKKTLVFLHGWGATAKTFEPLFYYLKDNFNIHALDLPGFGNTPIEKIMTLKNYAEFVYEFLKNNQIKDPIIIGHSFGGAVAVKFALLYPNEISKLILIGAAALREPSVKTRALRILAAVLKPFLPEKIKKTILKLLGLEKSDYAVIENENLKETFKIITSENLAPYLNTVKIPSLLIWGDKDTETPVEQGKKIASLISDSRIEILKGGHFIFLDKPAETASLIKEFVQ